MSAYYIRPFLDTDAVEITSLFHGAVHSICSKIYTPEQKEAWAPTPPDCPAWCAKLRKKKPLVAVKDGVVVGFLELESGEDENSEQGHIDCFYVHKDYQREGVGQQLLAAALKRSQELGFSELVVEASKVARPIFEMADFRYQKTNQVSLRGQVLESYSMVLLLK